MRFSIIFLHIINKPRFLNGDGNWTNLLNGAVITYSNNLHCTIKMTPVDESNNPEKVRYLITSNKYKSKLKDDCKKCL